MPEFEEEYELVPLNPVRRLEKRVARIEKTGTSSDTTKELLDIVRVNQTVIEEVVKIDSEMIKRVSELSDAVGKMLEKMNEFFGRIEVAGEQTHETGSPEIAKKVDERLVKLEKRVNALLLSAMSKQGIKNSIPLRRYS